MGLNAPHAPHALNIELLDKVKEAILAEPAQFVMGELFSDRLLNTECTCGCHEDGWDLARKIPNCGTAACIAGWTVTLHMGLTPAAARKVKDDPWVRAARLLGIHGPGMWDAKLFEVSQWPSDLEERWHAEKSLEGRAGIAAERIERFKVEWAAEEARKADKAEGK